MQRHELPRFAKMASGISGRPKDGQQNTVSGRAFGLSLETVFWWLIREGFLGGQALKWTFNKGHGVAGHMSRGDCSRIWEDVLDSFPPLPLLPPPLPHYSSPCPSPHFLSAFSPLAPHLLFLVFFFPAYFGPDGGPWDITSLTPWLAPW